MPALQGNRRENRRSLWSASDVLTPADKGRDYFFFALAVAAALSAYFFWKRSTRPAVSISFCLPVKNGWHCEQISTRINSPLLVERV